MQCRAALGTTSQAGSVVALNYLRFDFLTISL
jgi:hypothetical protein